ncbi:MAG: hypothetical protein MUF71_05515 [Candidatus Kapabacteria bacterium]|jgi:hypothetical protein|nr:hypothetical protein [Candidatus Kapabacteria bacterium]
MSSYQKQSLRTNKRQDQELAVHPNAVHPSDVRPNVYSQQSTTTPQISQTRARVCALRVSGSRRVVVCLTRWTTGGIAGTGSAGIFAEAYECTLMLVQPLQWLPWCCV